MAIPEIFKRKSAERFPELGPIDPTSYDKNLGILKRSAEIKMRPRRPFARPI